MCVSQSVVGFHHSSCNGLPDNSVTSGKCLVHEAADPQRCLAQVSDLVS